MTRLFNIHCELGDILAWDSTNSVSATTTQKRFGNYSFLISSGSGFAIKNVSDLSEFYLRFAFRVTTNTGGSGVIVNFRHSTTSLAALDFDGGTKKFTIYGQSSLAATVTADTWYLIEIYLKIADAPNGRCVVYVDGIKEIDFTGDTKPGSDAHIDNLYFDNEPRAGGSTYFADIAANDTSNADGKNDNSWCMDGRYEYHPANDNGDVSNWTGSDGDKVNNYALVDEVPADASDYVKSSTLGEQDMYKVTSFDDTGKIVTRIFSEARAKDNAVAGGKIKLGFKSGGTVTLCAADRSLSGSVARVVGDDAKVNPGDSGAWEKSDLDAIQDVIECE